MAAERIIKQLNIFQQLLTLVPLIQCQHLLHAVIVNVFVCIRESCRRKNTTSGEIINTVLLHGSNTIMNMHLHWVKRRNSAIFKMTLLKYLWIMK